MDCLQIFSAAASLREHLHHDIALHGLVQPQELDERRRLEAGEALTFLLGNGQKLQAKLIFLENNGMD